MTALSRRTGYRLGLRAENIAAWLLRAKGYRVLERRFASRAGEIDLIARKGRSLVFCEVKARANLESAAESIRPFQRARIVRGAEDFLSRNPHYTTYDLRFDAILIAPRKMPRHIKAAFDAGA